MTGNIQTAELELPHAVSMWLYHVFMFCYMKIIQEIPGFVYERININFLSFSLLINLYCASLLQILIRKQGSHFKVFTPLCMFTGDLSCTMDIYVCVVSEATTKCLMLATWPQLWNFHIYFRKIHRIPSISQILSQEQDQCVQCTKHHDMSPDSLY